nr:hypothetical protein Iba_scaffold59353CG0010 [Ipomoea batatas]GMD76633.1 hypothetical protein Iba_chr13bCG12050 [Ipomoea batatas]GMD77419.1 hypothetical protein Iba_chr13cCG3140 [Ipomoea batatas]GME12940.1 hypothetical protein Iba_scaffold14246CG0010 [Ipomoea batatas]
MLEFPLKELHWFQLREMEAVQITTVIWKQRGMLIYFFQPIFGSWNAWTIIALDG